MKLKFTVPGPPQPKERARQGKGRRWYTPERTRRYESAVREMMQLSAPKDWPTDVEYHVEVASYFPDARDRDADNVMKAVCDAGNKCLYRDDSQVVRTVSERFVDRERPRTEVTVTACAVERVVTKRAAKRKAGGDGHQG